MRFDIVYSFCLCLNFSFQAFTLLGQKLGLCFKLLQLLLGLMQILLTLPSHRLLIFNAAKTRSIDASGPNALSPLHLQ